MWCQNIILTTVDIAFAKLCAGYLAISALVRPEQHAHNKAETARHPSPPQS